MSPADYDRFKSKIVDSILWCVFILIAVVGYGAAIFGYVAKDTGKSTIEQHHELSFGQKKP